MNQTIWLGTLTAANAILALLNLEAGNYFAASFHALAVTILLFTLHLKFRTKARVWSSSVNVIERDGELAQCIIVTVFPEEYLEVKAVPSSLGPMIVGPFSFQNLPGPLSTSWPVFPMANKVAATYNLGP